VRKGSWYCQFRIVQGTKIIYEDVATGGDALQAIVIAVQGLRYRYRRSGLRAFWNEYMEPSGLPLYIPSGAGRRLDRQIERAVKETIESLIRKNDLKRERARRSRRGRRRT
jgi:hypothetical protein